MISNERLIELYRMKTLTRYNSRQKIQHESVAEHSFFVAVMGLLIADELKLDDQKKYQILVRTLLHDMPESELNDITHDVKVKLGLYEFLAPYENDYFKRVFPEHADICSSNLASTDQKIVQLICALADALSVKQFALSEIELGNQTKKIHEILEDGTTRSDNLWTQIKENYGY